MLNGMILKSHLNCIIKVSNFVELTDGDCSRGAVAFLLIGRLLEEGLLFLSAELINLNDKNRGA